MGRENLDAVAAHPKCAANEILVVAPVLQGNEALQQIGDHRGVAYFQRNGHRLI